VGLAGRRGQWTWASADGLVAAGVVSGRALGAAWAVPPGRCLTIILENGPACARPAEVWIFNDP